MKIFVRDYHLKMLIGIYAHEVHAPQDVVANIEAEVAEPPDWRQDEMNDWVDYQTFVEAVQTIADEGHINLLETFAHKIAERLTQDRRILSLTIRLEKTAAIPGTRSVGVEYCIANRGL